MTESVWNHLGIDPLYVIFGQAILTIILMIVVIICIFKIRRLYRSYDYFMRGRDEQRKGRKESIVSSIPKQHPLIPVKKNNNNNLS